MDAFRIHGKPKFGAEFNCWLICKQRSPVRTAVGSRFLHTNCPTRRLAASAYASAVCGTRPDKPLPDKGTKAVGIEGNCIVQVGQAVREANVPWIGADGDKDRVTLASQRSQNSSLPSIELGQVSR